MPLTVAVSAVNITSTIKRRRIIVNEDLFDKVNRVRQGIGETGYNNLNDFSDQTHAMD